MFIESWGDDPRFPGLTLELEADLRIREHPPGGNEIFVDCLLRIFDPQIEDNGKGWLDLTGAWNAIQAALRENKSAIAAALDSLPASSDRLAAISPQYRAMEPPTFSCQGLLKRAWPSAPRASRWSD